MTGPKDTMALPTNFKLRPDNIPKNKGNDRILQLKIKDDTLPKRSTGLVDTSIFKGDNKLHAVYDENKQLWYLRYERGVVPPVLQQHFTSFTALMKILVPYFEKRNIEVSEIYA